MTRTIALIAHRGREHDLVELVDELREELERCRLVANRSTAALLREEADLEVEQIGDAGLGTMVASGEIDLVVAPRDPFGPLPQELDLRLLPRICATRRVPLANDMATARSSLASLDRILARSGAHDGIPAAWLA